MNSELARVMRAPARTSAREGRPFRGIDGEGITVDGTHLYVELGAGSGESIAAREGLSTEQCFDFLLRESLLKPSSLLVAFAFNYDVNMILRDVPRPQLEELWATGETLVTFNEQEYYVEWIPSKLFGVRTNDPITGKRIACKVWDTWGYFQSSFVRALETWEVPDPGGMIARMKSERAGFQWEQLEEITAYNLAECELLGELMERVRAALHAVELRPRSWLGAGSIASALFQKNEVRKHLSPPRAPHLEEDILLRAYFGGRTEVFRQGQFGRAVAWDINSAYPYATTLLPTGAGEWKRRREYEPLSQFALWRVEWDTTGNVAPFPFRDRRSIYYPLSGEGWYHAVEVAEAIRHFGDSIRVTSGYVFEPANDEKPFAFLRDVYEERRSLKAEGHPSEKVLKLGINSVYGKLAQGNARNGNRPPYQDYFWAGYITANCRARVLGAIMQAPDAVCSVATDGILFTEEADELLTVGYGLGDWERTRYRDLFIAQPGMYYAHLAAGGKPLKKSRGFFVREIDFPKLVKLWSRMGPEAQLPCKSNRFIGLGSALMRSDFGVWRSWENGLRNLSLYTSRKHYGEISLETGIVNLYPPDEVKPGLSDPYTPKRQIVELEPEEADWVQGAEQPDPALQDA